MIFRLFLSFLKIGAVSFGGGYGMISLFKENNFSSEQLVKRRTISVLHRRSRIHPGPLAINMATFVGSETCGFWGTPVGRLRAWFCRHSF